MAAGHLPLSLADVDRLIYAAAIYHRHNVVTGDGNLITALTRAKLRAVGLAWVLNELVVTSVLSQAEHEGIVASLAARYGSRDAIRCAGGVAV